MTLFCLEAGLQACRCTGDKGQQCLCARRRASSPACSPAASQSAELLLRNPACLPKPGLPLILPLAPCPAPELPSAELVRQVIEEELQAIHAELGSSEK